MVKRRHFLIVPLLFLMVTLWVSTTEGDHNPIRGERLSDELATFDDSELLYDLAVESMSNANYVDAVAYMTAHLVLFPDIHEEPLAYSLDWALYHLQSLYETCFDGCSRDQAETAGILVTYSYPGANRPAPPAASAPALPDYTDLPHNDMSILCRGGVEEMFQNAQGHRWQLVTAFEKGDRLSRSLQNADALSAGECGLIGRSFTSSQRTNLMLPATLFDDGLSIEWGIDGAIETVGRARNMARSNGLQLVPNSDTLRMASSGTVVAQSVSSYKALEHLQSADHYQTFAVYVDDNDNFVVTDIGHGGAWSRFEQDELQFRNGQQPTVSYSGMSDVTLSQDAPQTRYGSQANCFVDGDDPPDSKLDKATLLRWEIDAIPLGSVVDEVSITLEVSNSSEDNYYLLGMRTDWHESWATWEMATRDESWTRAGTTTAGDRGYTILGVLREPAVGQQTLELNASGRALVQQWIDDPKQNHGFIMLSFGSDDGVDFACSEATEVDQRPKLTLRFTSQ